MSNKIRDIKVISNGSCPIETINGFNRRIAEIIEMKFSKNIIEKIIHENEKNNINIMSWINWNGIKGGYYDI